jgi:hypothetical protein
MAQSISGIYDWEGVIYESMLVGIVYQYRLI